MVFLRSENIIHKKLRLPGDTDSAIRILDAIGNIDEDVLEFIDLNTDNIEGKKLFESMLQRCELNIKTISFFEEVCERVGIQIFPYDNYRDFKEDIQRDQETRVIQRGAYFDVLEAELIDINSKIKEIFSSTNKIKEDLAIDKEKKIVFEKYLTLMTSRGSNGLLFIIGVCKAVDEMKMKRMFFRASRGTAISNFFNSENEEMKDKKIFIIFYPSDGREVLQNKLFHICDIFNASRYQIDNQRTSSNDIIRTVNDLKIAIKEKEEIINESNNQIKYRMTFICGDNVRAGKIDMYKLYFKKMRMIYENLAKCIVRENFIDCEVWVIESQYQKIIQALSNENDHMSSSGTFIDLYDANLKKPTYIKSNEFLMPFQEIVNTYGIPRYQEINPAYFNIVFFPFLFGIMFGDIGHGLILFLIGIYLVVKSDQIKEEKSILSSIVPYRYFILLMGFFSFYCGLMYNDFIGVPLPIFKSCYINTNNKETHRKENCVYPIGFDHKWFSSTNELSFTNSLKMKFSVIIGVIQMIFGIAIEGANHVFYHDWVSFAFVFIPQMLFMCLIFGYMDIMIIIKWCKTFKNTSKAPSIITQVINIFLNYGSVDNNPLWGKTKKIHGKYQQEKFQLAILSIAVSLIPIMLFFKPVINYFILNTNKRKKNPNHRLLVDELDEEEKLMDRNRVMKQYSHFHDDSKNFVEKSFVDILVEQLIETIEFILGAVSNTASYLRLWALSLAHSQLSKVFLEKTVISCFKGGNFNYGLNVILLIIGFFIFANVTIFVLMFMDLMECFLHTLRLHWVEFQNKFFKADGYLFVPFNFKKLIKQN